MSLSSPLSLCVSPSLFLSLYKREKYSHSDNFSTYQKPHEQIILQYISLSKNQKIEKHFPSMSKPQF